MNDKPEITDQQLVKLAGEKAFSRGKGYYQEGRVTDLTIRGQRISASVMGSEVYQVNLVYTQSALDGSCNCPASDGIDFCKHCVAVAMVLRDKVSVPRVKKGAQATDVLAAYLLQMPKEELVGHFVEMIDASRSVREHWLLKAETALGIMDRKTIRKRITAAIPYNRHYFRYAQVRQYFANVEQVLSNLEPPLKKLAATDQLALLDYAMSRIVRALETVDDSGGFRFEAVAQLQRMYVEAFASLNWSEASKAQHLLELLLKDEDEWHGRVPDDFSEVMTPECQKTFLEIARARWDELPRLKSDNWRDRLIYDRLLSVLQVEPELENDYKTLIQLYKKIAMTEKDYLVIARCYLELDEHDEVHNYLDRARQSSRFGESAEIHELQQLLLLKTGRSSEALQDVWEQFKESPTLSTFEYLQELSQDLNSQQDWRQKAIDWMKERVVSTQGYLHHRVLNTLMMTFLAESDLESAWQLVTDAEPDVALLFELRKHFRQDGERSFALYGKLVEACLQKKTNNSYKEAVELMAECQQILTGLNQQQAFSHWFEELREKHKAKRNFIRFLGEAFPGF
ncbi:SWIM zinc finger family protein [Endozoicomonas sp. ALC020]|uniref:SWIM zinc finger family protein n=1 Tax=unclassified Endozoicomonas TaxID=2644528 RepID=UPI003BAFED2C